MRLWKFLLCLNLAILILGVSRAQADPFNISGNMGNQSSFRVGAYNNNVNFIGFASPNAVVFFLENNVVIGTTLADGNSEFNKTFEGLSDGIHVIGVYATDTNSVNTVIVNYSVSVALGETVNLGIVLPPSFSTPTDRVNRPASLIATGRGQNSTALEFFISGSRDSFAISTTIDANGDWSLNLNPKLHLGSKTAYGIILDRIGRQSEPSNIKYYTVVRSSDLNNDGSVNLTDFSILMYSYGKLPLRNVISDINDNGIVDLVDFSIMMSQWSR